MAWIKRSRGWKAELLASHRHVVGAKPAGKEFWLYEDAPPGHDIHVVITDGVLESAKVFSQSAGGDPKDSPSSAGTRKSAVRTSRTATISIRRRRFMRSR